MILLQGAEERTAACARAEPTGAHSEDDDRALSAAIKRSAQARPGLRMIVAAKSAASVEESCAATAKFRKIILFYFFRKKEAPSGGSKADSCFRAR